MYKRTFYTLLTLIFIFNACAPDPYSKTNRLYKAEAKQFARNIREIPTSSLLNSVGENPYWIGTTNFNLRKPNYVIIHHTAQNSCDATLRAFTMTKSQVSAHYVICKDGTVHHMLNDYLRSWHAGISKWGNNTDINSSSIGIELDNNGFESFPDAQINSLLHVLKSLKEQFKIPVANFIGHGDIAPTRKNDPNVSFPWELLAQKGYGLWFTDITAMVPEQFDNITALRIIGYDTRDTGAAIQAFNRHFMKDTSKIIDESARKVLFDLSKKYF